MGINRFYSFLIDWREITRDKSRTALTNLSRNCSLLKIHLGVTNKFITPRRRKVVPFEMLNKIIYSPFTV